MKILFDTNVYVSEALVGGLAEEIVEAVISACGRIFVSGYLLGEVERVLHDKLGFSARFAMAVRQRIRRRCDPVDSPPSRHQVPTDPKDGPILRAAINAGADYLVTDDHHLRKLHPYEGIQIVSMKEFATLLINEGLLSKRR